MLYTFRHFTVFALLLWHGVLCVSADDSPQTRELRVKTNEAAKARATAQTQIVIRKAALETQQKRVADLQKQLKAAQARAEVENKALQAAIQNEQKAAQQLEQLTAQLKNHEKADQLVAAAEKLKSRLEQTQQQQKSLTAELQTVLQSLKEQKQAEAKAASALQAAQKALPTTQEELKKAREQLDAVARDVDAAKIRLEAARKEVRMRQQSVADVVSQVRRAEQAAARAAESLKALQEHLKTLQESALAAGISPDEAGKELAAAVATVQQLHQTAQQVVQQAIARRDAVQKELQQAIAARDAAEAEFQKQQQKYAEIGRTHFQLQLKVSDLQNSVPLYSQQIEQARAAQQQLLTQQKELQQKIEAANADIRRLNEEYIAARKQAEAALESVGRFVSFARSVAPILASRCVACHNARTTGGRLDVNSYAALLKGGESGPAVVPHNPDESLLIIMVEDGSMPKDADPLTKEQIDVLKQWVAVGAPMDTGLSASAPLFDIMPETPQPLPPETYRVPIPVTATAFSPDGNLLASSGYHEILLWNATDNSLVRRITNVAERVYDLEFSADGSLLAVAAGTPGQLGEVKLFSTADGSHQKTLIRTRDAVLALALRPDGKQLAAGGADRIVYVAEIESGRVVNQIEDHADWVMDVNWSPDGAQLVTASRDKTSRVFRADDATPLTTFSGHNDTVYTAAFLKDGKQICSGGSDRQLRIWQAADGKEVRKIGGFGGDIFRLLVTPENQILTACADRNVRRHNAADGKLLQTYSGHKDWVYTLAYAAQTKVLATGSYDGEIRLWNAEDGKVTRSFIAIPGKQSVKNVAAQP